jgi:hypothetical protein
MLTSEAYYVTPEEGVVVPIIGLISHPFHFLLLPRIVLDLCRLFQGSQHTLTLERHCLSSDVKKKRIMILSILEIPIAK